MVLSIVSICLSSFTALIVTIMPIIQTLIKNRNDRKMEKYKHVQQEQRKTYNDLLEKYIDYSLSINETTKRNLCIAISKAELFAKSDVEKRRSFILRSMLIKQMDFDVDKFIDYMNLNIKMAWQEINNIYI